MIVLVKLLLYISSESLPITNNLPSRGYAIALIIGIIYLLTLAAATIPTGAIVMIYRHLRRKFKPKTMALV